MKNVCQQGTLLIILLITVITSNAQDKSIPPAADRAAKLTEWMKTNLQLTDEQLPKIQDINLKYAKKADEFRSMSMGKRQKLQKLKADGAAKDQELKTVLNADQYKIYESKKQELQKQFKEKAKERR